MPSPIPDKLNLQKDRQLEIIWQNGHTSIYPLTMLRSMCPCAQCRLVRESSKERRTSLTILPGNYTETPTVLAAELVGNYAIKIEWSDQHSSGIYSFQYLSEIDPSRRG